MSALVLLLYQAARMTPQLYSASWKSNTRWPIKPNVSKYLRVTKRNMDVWDVLCLVCMSSVLGCGVALLFPIRLLINYTWCGLIISTILMACTFSTNIPLLWTFKYSIETVVNRNHQLPVHSSVPRVAWDVSAESCEIARQTPYFLPTLGQASNCWWELWRDSSGRPWDSKPSASLVMPIQRSTWISYASNRQAHFALMPSRQRID